MGHSLNTGEWFASGDGLGEGVEQSRDVGSEAISCENWNQDPRRERHISDECTRDQTPRSILPRSSTA